MKAMLFSLSLFFVVPVFAQPAEPLQTRNDLLWAELKLKRNLGVMAGTDGVQFNGSSCNCLLRISSTAPVDRQIVFSVGRSFSVSRQELNPNTLAMVNASLVERAPPAESAGYGPKSLECRLTNPVFGRTLCSTDQIKFTLSGYFDVTHFTYPNVEANVVDQDLSQGLVFEGELPDSVAHGI
jgi:hypothetical protein